MSERIVYTPSEHGLTSTEMARRLLAVAVPKSDVHTLTGHDETEYEVSPETAAAYEAKYPTAPAAPVEPVKPAEPVKPVEPAVPAAPAGAPGEGVPSSLDPDGDGEVRLRFDPKSTYLAPDGEVDITAHVRADSDNDTTPVKKNGKKGTSA